jgi:hypothetical protein
MKTKTNRQSRNLIIALLLGDGTICNNNVFKLSHGHKQKEYLEWKIKLMNANGIRNNGLKSYTCTTGYNKGELVYYSQLNITKFIKVLKRVFYKPKKIIANRKLLNRLDAQGVAIWFMDDGCINVQYSSPTKEKVKSFAIRMATCISKADVQIVIDYFKDVWDVSFYAFSEGKGTYSICCGTKQARKFIEIVKPYIIPSLMYKIGVGRLPEMQNIVSQQ